MEKMQGVDVVIPIQPPLWTLQDRSHTVSRTQDYPQPGEQAKPHQLARFGKSTCKNVLDTPSVRVCPGTVEMLDKCYA